MNTSPHAFQVTDELIRQAVNRDACERSAVLQPDGETVHAPDGDLGFSLSLAEWRRFGGRDLPPFPRKTSTPRSDS